MSRWARASSRQVRTYVTNAGRANIEERRGWGMEVGGKGGCHAVCRALTSIEGYRYACGSGATRACGSYPRPDTARVCIRCMVQAASRHACSLLPVDCARPSLLSVVGNDAPCPRPSPIENRTSSPSSRPPCVQCAVCV
ncbi:hypothetical protein OH76DRAFT_537771 [Lentinus brumalis]|uniref:Uncharacterized protein n=1 Tax=Lentinus brumalis TaxID=2498619 RepID=A0A371CHM7_9APHY|nr:hypothetical protein OH76DRAFT_537771 [Polyporus brumalis]